MPMHLDSDSWNEYLSDWGSTNGTSTKKLLISKLSPDEKLEWKLNSIHRSNENELKNKVHDSIHEGHDDPPEIQKSPSKNFYSELIEKWDKNTHSSNSETQSSNEQKDDSVATNSTNPEEDLLLEYGFQLLEKTAEFWNLKEEQDEQEALLIEQEPDPEEKIRSYVLSMYDSEMEEINKKYILKEMDSFYEEKRKLDMIKTLYNSILNQEDPVLMFQLGEMIIKKREIFKITDIDTLEFENNNSNNSKINKNKSINGNSKVVKLIQLMKQSLYRESIDGKAHYLEISTDNTKNNKQLIETLLKWYSTILSLLLQRSTQVESIQENLESSAEMVKKEKKVTFSNNLERILNENGTNTPLKGIKESNASSSNMNDSTIDTSTISIKKKPINYKSLIGTVQYRCGSLEWILKSYQRSLRYFKASSHIIPESALNSFAIYFHGLGQIKKDINEAIKILEQSILNFPKDGRFYYYSGMCHEIGAGTSSRDYRKALNLYEKSASYNHIPAMMHLFKWYLMHDPRRDPRIVGKYVSSNFPIIEQMSNSDMSYCDISIKIIPYDPERAFMHLTRCAIDFDDPLAQYYLAIHNLDGRYMAKDPQKAFDLLQKSANKGNSLSMHKLTLLFTEGTPDGSIKPSLENALYWAEMGAKQGNLWCSKICRELQEIVYMNQYNAECTVEGLQGLEDALIKNARIVYFFDKISQNPSKIQRQNPFNSEIVSGVSHMVKKYVYPLKKLYFCCSTFELGALKYFQIPRSKLPLIGFWIFASKNSSTLSSKHIQEILQCVHQLNCKEFQIELYQDHEDGTDWIINEVDLFFKEHENDTLLDYSIIVHGKMDLIIKSKQLDDVILNNNYILKIKNKST